MICSKCWKDKPEESFPKRDGKPRKQCKSCRNAYAREQNRLYPDKYKEQRRRYQLKNKYSMTEEDYEELLANQLGGCAICKEPPHESRNGVLDIDHCHDTGEVRGLLCHKCNMGLGSFDDKEWKLEQAILYLERYQKNG